MPTVRHFIKPML